MSSPEGHKLTPDDAPSYSSFLEAYSKDINLVNVRDRTYGIFVSYIAEAYDALPKEEKNKIGKVSSRFCMHERNVEAALEYRRVYPDVIEARILLNKAYSSPDTVSEKEKERAEQVIYESKGKKDPFLPFDSEDLF